MRLIDIAKVIMCCPPPKAGRAWRAGGMPTYTASTVAKMLGCSIPTVNRYWRDSRDRSSDLAYMIRALKKGVK